MAKQTELIVRTVFGRRANFHGTNCAESFREDRKHGLIYGPLARPNGSLYAHVEQASLACDFCAYCGPTVFASA